MRRNCFTLFQSDNLQTSATAFAQFSAKMPLHARVPSCKMSGKIDTREFSISDYDAAVSVLQPVERFEIVGRVVTEGSSQFLTRNPERSRGAFCRPPIVW